jgi:hypothetical protein
MPKPMRMSCTVSHDAESPWMFRISAVMFDGTPLSFKTERHNVELNEDITLERPTVTGWVNVQHEAQQGSLVKITLPSPSLEYGKNVNVEQNVLMPLGVSLDRFNPRKI